MTVHFERYSDVVEALADPALVPILPSGDGPVGASVAWLRATVARFSSGETHRRRRALVEAELAQLDPGSLRTAVVRAGDLRIRVVRTLAEAMGMPEPDVVAEAVTVVARAYFGGDDPAADEAVARLVSLLQPDDLEVVANRIGVLVQACDATAALVEAAERNLLPLARVLLEDPPVRNMRRIAVRPTRVGDQEIAEGDVVLLDTANPEHPETLTFGAAPRVCPGRAHALALAEGLRDGSSSGGGVD
jgi:cytochrome P450